MARRISYSFASFIASLLVVIATPVLLIASNSKLLALSPLFYRAEHDKLGVAQAMGVSAELVQKVALAVIDYLQAAPDSLPALMTQHGASPDYFSPRDHIHMIDVHALVQMVFQSQTIGLILGAVGLVGIILLATRKRDEVVASRILRGSIFTMVLLVIIGLVAFTNFDAVFLQFHYLAFTNDFWILDPSVDRLIVNYPPTFFYDMALAAAVLSFVEAAIIAIVTGVFLFVKRRRQRVSARV
jgi:integral membrane protein (TIGR01906 family)